MNERVEVYLRFKKQEQRDRQKVYRDKVLMEEGLYDRLYVSAEEDTWDNSLTWDPQVRRYYKKVAMEVTDEEFAAIEKYAAKTVQRDVETGMFANIGDKIMDLAQFECWIGIIGSILSGIVMMAADGDMVLYGLLTMVLGSIGAWIGSWFTYAFGQMVKDLRQVTKNTRKE